MKKYLIVILFGCLSLNAYAAPPEWHTSTINRIQTNQNKIITIYINGSNHSCGSVGLKFDGNGQPGAEWVFSALLAYQA